MRESHDGLFVQESEREPEETKDCSPAVLKALVRFHKKLAEVRATRVQELEDALREAIEWLEYSTPEESMAAGKQREFAIKARRALEL